jgi:hypothetical protein
MEHISKPVSRVVDRWGWWQAALADPHQIGKTLIVHESEPQQGYYRTRRKDRQWEPVALYFPEDSDTIVGYRANREVQDVNELWVWCCRHPISYEAYQKAVDGGGFDDEPPASAGHNSGSDDPFEALRQEYLGEKEQAEEYMRQPVKTQAQADRVAIWSKRLTDIAKRADQMRVTEKQPHLDACRAVDDKFRELKEEPDVLAKRLKAHIKPFLQEQIRAEEERQRKAREEADRARRAAEEAARTAAESDQQQSEREREAAVREAERQAALARAAEAEAEARKVNAGRTGARVSMRKEKVGVVTDYAKAAAALVAMKHKDIIAVIDQLAQRAAKAGMPFDGMDIREEGKVV